MAAPSKNKHSRERSNFVQTNDYLGVFLGEESESGESGSDSGSDLNINDLQSSSDSESESGSDCENIAPVSHIAGATGDASNIPSTSRNIPSHSGTTRGGPTTSNIPSTSNTPSTSGTSNTSANTTRSRGRPRTTPSATASTSRASTSTRGATATQRSTTTTGARGRGRPGSTRAATVTQGDGDNTNTIDSGWNTIDDLENDQSPPLHDFQSEYGPVFAPVDAAPVDYFERFFRATGNNGKSLWEILVSETNSYHAYYMSQDPILKPKSKVKQWKDVDIPQMKAFIGLLLNMGILRKHSIVSYWNSTHYSQDTPMFRKVFKLETFKLILRFFHVSSRVNEPARGTAEYDIIYKFRPVLEHLVGAWAREYKLGAIISIDESIVGFKGRHKLVNYIRIKKHHQWGPKEYNLCDSRTGYTYNTMYHVKGLGTSEHGQPFDVCDKLVSPHAGKHHHLIVDNYYTSVALCEKMLEKGIYVTGTIQSNRRNLPSSMKTKLKAKGDIIACRKGSLLAINWMDRKQVRLLSTHCVAGSVDVERYNGNVKNIPKVVAEYNHGMGGVDMADQMTDCYAGEFRTVKCWKKVVFHLIDRTVTNAYVCYKSNPNVRGKRLTHYEFIIQLVEGLVGGYQEPRTRVGM